MANEKDTALDGLRVLEIAQGLSSSLCGRLLTELGSEVIKIEFPVSDNVSNSPPFKSEWGSYDFGSLSVNKKSMTVDLTGKEGKKILERLVKVSDILIEDYSVGTMDNLGIGYNMLSKVNSQLIYCSITPFGQNGPLSSKKSTDIVVQAMSGIMASTGFPQDPPTKAGFPIGEFISSVYAAIGILAAIHYREGSERGQAIDISMNDCLLSYFATYLPTTFMTGEMPPRRGNRHTMCSPWNSYEAKDGWVIICTANDEEWNRLLDVMGCNDLKNDQRFNTVEKRVKREEEVDAIVSKWTKRNTIENIIKVLEGAKVAVAPIFNVDELITDSHFLYRHMVTEVSPPSKSKTPVIGSTFKMSETPGVIKTAAPLLGQHTEELLVRVLGYSQKDVQNLKTKGVI